MNYNTDINIIGSIPDYHLIVRAIPLLNVDDVKLKKILIEDNEFNFRTEKSRDRFFNALKSAFVTNNPELDALFRDLVVFVRNNKMVEMLVLFWIFSIKNRLFYEINKDVYLKYYYQGRTGLPVQEVLAYLKDKINQNKELKGRWSEKTIQTIASKYLTILKKLGLLEGGQKKNFIFVSISDEMLALFVHLYKLNQPGDNNIMDDEFFIFSFVSKESLLDRMKRLGKKGLIRMNYTGTALRVEGVFEPNDIIHGIFGRTQG